MSTIPAERDDRRASITLLAGFIGVGIFSVGIGAAAVMLIDHRMDLLGEFHSPVLIAVQKHQAHIAEAAQEVYAYLATGDPSDKQEYLDQAAVLPSHTAELREIARVDEPGEEQERALLEAIEIDQSQFIAEAAVLIARHESGQAFDPADLARFEAVAESLTSRMAALGSIEEAEVLDGQAAMASLVTDAERLVLAVSLGTLLAAAAAGLMLRHRVLDILEQRENLLRRIAYTERLESLGVLARGVAHDFNNLLTAILGNTELARSSMDRGEAPQESVDAIEVAVHQGAGLVRRIFAQARAEPPRLELFDLGTLVGELTQVLSSAAPEGVSLRRLPTDADPWVEGDPTQLRQVVLNLIVNAFECMDGMEGSVQVSTGIRHCGANEISGWALGDALPPGDYAWIRVSDSGSGMDVETRSHMFDPFFSTKGPSRGLGLSSLPGILEECGAGMHVESTPGKGTSFELLLPSKTRTGSPQKAAAPRDRSSTGPKTLLVVDDLAPVRTVTARLLEERGYRAWTSGSAQEGLDVLEAERGNIDAILLDLSMPGMDGLAMLRQLRAEGHELPVMLYSGHASEQCDALCRDDRRLAFLQKPFTGEELAESLQSLFVAAG